MQSENERDSSASQSSVSAFFDSIAGEYTDSIRRCVPRYDEMLWALLDYLPQKTPRPRILELGCGTGNLSALIQDRFPDSELTLVDISGDCIATCKRRLNSDGQLEFVQAGFQELSFAPASFDLVLSSISIHHLTSRQKRRLFSNLEDWLTEFGVFSYSDQFRGVTDDVYARHIEHWKSEAATAGAANSEWSMWLKHQQEHDFHDSLIDQLDWLRNAGFGHVDCTWRYLLWSVIQARKAGVELQ